MTLTPSAQGLDNRAPVLVSTGSTGADGDSAATITAPGHQPPPATRWRMRVAPSEPRTDVDAAEQAAAELLSALGLDLSDHLADTPRRMARALLEMTTAPEFAFTTFPNDGEHSELVLVRDIPVHSLCEHHMLPFVGVAHIGYLPGSRILGLSKFARLVDFHARRPQTQERLTTRIADHLQSELDPDGVGVVIEAAHTCMSLRGVRVPGTRTHTSALHGRLRDDPSDRADFLALTRQAS